MLADDNDTLSVLLPGLSMAGTFLSTHFFSQFRVLQHVQNDNLIDIVLHISLQ